MPEFQRRPPEWQQSADRHTRLVDPVLTVRQLSRFEFSRRALTRIDHALVFTSPKGSYDTFLPPQRPSRAEVAARRYTAVYEVDMGVHPSRAELPLPSDNDAFEFGAVIDLSWQVADPARFVAAGHRDVPALLISELQGSARQVTRRYGVDHSAEAEAALLREMTGWAPLGAAAGLRVTWTLRLRRDQESIDHQRRLQAIDHSSAEQVRAHRRGMECDLAADERARQQDALQIGRAMEYGHAQQDLALQQQRWQHQQALLQGRQALELQQVEADKIAFYQWHLQQGGVQAWALHLAQHPEDSKLVMTSMREDQLRLIHAQMDLVKQLLSSDNAENYEMEGPKQLALRTVSDILTQRLPGVPQQPPGPPPSELPPWQEKRTGPADATEAPGAGEAEPQASAPPFPGAVPPPPAGPPTPPAWEAPAYDGSADGWRPPPGYGHSPASPTPPDSPPRPGGGAAPDAEEAAPQESRTP
ncbi:hypothetical protein [Streptomyces sp. A1499]|uniref:hypothetical protein n=1 Tax=Streptomyces sp. A1499 TaxID=2563104 RepID=UPI00109E94BB|nr:hypothetical protein [Streptomyces sp. A1499]THC53294.1 hypothetical protein E7X58_08590 [Streptomyces sp. A1499]